MPASGQPPTRRMSAAGISSPRAQVKHSALNWLRGSGSTTRLVFTSTQASVPGAQYELIMKSPRQVTRSHSENHGSPLFCTACT
jgi:hypothetical protein